MSSGSSSGINNGSVGMQLSLEQMTSQLIATSNEQRLVDDLLIKNKFNDKQQGKEVTFTESNKKIYIENGIKRTDFIIDIKGKLHLGKGHSFMAKGESVLAAGMLKIGTGGIARRVTNLSGHYQPTVKETVRYLNMMHSNGYITRNTWVDIFEFDKDRSGYVSGIRTVYSGPYQFLNRRITR